MTISPIPKDLTNLLAQGKGGNAALYFSRMPSWTWNEREKKLESKHQSGTDHRGRSITDSSIVALGAEINLRLPASKPVLDTIHARQSSILKTEVARGGMVWEFRARLLSPFVSGLGSGHPTETGMILDRNSGLPYIPASAVKGVLRLAHALDIAEQYAFNKINIPQDKEGNFVIDDRLPTLRRYFGDTNTGKADSVRGQLVFLDAFPASTPAIKPDIINPHFGAYYSGKQGPLETENPIPVKFLTVTPTTEFVFRCFASPLPVQGQAAQVVEVARPFDSNDEQSVIAMFTRAFDQLGFGGKTSIGYGRFVLVAKNTADHFKSLVAQDVERRLQEEVQRQQEEEIRRYPWRPLLAGLEQVNDWGMLRQKFLDSNLLQEHQIQLEVAEQVKMAAERLRDANRKKWKPDWDSHLQQWLRPSGITWLAKGSVLTEADAGSTSEEQQQLDQIAALRTCPADNKWGQVSKIMETIDQLSKPAVLALCEVFKQEKWDKKDVKKGKQDAWKKLQARRKHLQGA